MNKFIKKSVSCLLSLVMVFGLLATGMLVPTADAEIDICGYSPAMSMSELLESGNDSVIGETYSISSAFELRDFATFVNNGGSTYGVTFYLSKDIDLADVEWVPIGSTAPHSFAGTFDGCGFAVLNLTAENAGNYFGLFGFTTVGAVIRNLGVNGSINGGTNVGGIVACLNNGTVENCWNAVDVKGVSNVGGIVGIASSGTLENCCNYGYITGSDSAGALAGALVTNSHIYHSYYVYYSADAACGKKDETSSSYVFRFASSSTEVLTEKELPLHDNGSRTTDDLIKLLNAWIDERDNRSLYRDWSFDISDDAMRRVAGRYPSIEYPGHIKSYENLYDATATMTELHQSGANAVSGGCYSISSSVEMHMFSDYVNSGYTTKGATFFLTRDIFLIGSSSEYMSLDEMIFDIADKNEDAVIIQWDPIGKSYRTPFRGVFDAQGYVVNGLFIKGTNELALFGYVDDPNAVIKNLGVCGYVIGNNNLGGIAVDVVNGSITNCWYDGAIIGSDTLGGIAAMTENGKITNCASFAEITGKSNWGALVGVTTINSTLKYCYYSCDNLNDCGSDLGVQMVIIPFAQNGTEFTLSRVINVAGNSTKMLLNALNHWVQGLSSDQSYRFWKVDDSTVSTVRLLAVHPTQLYPGDTTGFRSVTEPEGVLEHNGNPYNVHYNETATMTELYESGKDAIEGGHYSISSGKELKMLSQYTEAKHKTAGVTFYLTGDVTIAYESTGNNGDGWKPIGSDLRITTSSVSFSTFRGDFDGCGYTVIGMFISGEKLDEVGLFGQCVGSTIRNLGVIGDIVAELEVGGIVGRMSGGTIENCWSAVNIQAEDKVGGIAGDVTDTSIINCVSYCAMAVAGGTDTPTCGPIVGEATGKSRVEYCYYLDKIAIFLDYNSHFSSNTTVNIIPFNYLFQSEEYRCILDRASVIDDIASTDLLTSLNAWVYSKNSEVYCTWFDSTIILEIAGMKGHFPRLMQPDISVTGTDEEYCGDYTATSSMSQLYITGQHGIAGGYYSISDLDDLEAFQRYVNAGKNTEGITFFLTRDIDMSTRYSLAADRSWTPVGTETDEFSGVFDGQGYTLKNLYINSNANNRAFFGYVDGKDTVIKNLGISGIVRGANNSAGLVSHLTGSTIANCWVSVEVGAVASNGTAGGIVAVATGGYMVNCVNYGAAIGTGHYGALVAHAIGTKIEYSYYLYATTMQPYSGSSLPDPIAAEESVRYFNGTSAACIMEYYVRVDGQITRNVLSALKLYVDSHPEENYCYWSTGSTLEYIKLGVAGFPVLISASGTLGERDLKQAVVNYNNKDYYSVSSAIDAANGNENGGDIVLLTDTSVGQYDEKILNDNVRIVTGDYTLVLKSYVGVSSLNQLDGTFIVKDGGGIKLSDSGDYKRFMYSRKNADPSCNSLFYGTGDLNFVIKPAEEDGAYNISLHDGEFIVNSTIDSGNPHTIPGGSVLTIEQGATLTVAKNARIRTTGGAIIMNNGTVKIGNVTLDRNGGTKMVGVFEDDGGNVTLPFIYRDGYSLRGWSDGTTIYKADDKVTALKSVTLQAAWQIGDGNDPYGGDDKYDDDDEPVYDIPISVIQSSGGSISPSTTLAAKGQNITFTITPTPLTYVKSLIVDGKAVETDDAGNYTLVSISEPHSISALFAPIANVNYAGWENPFDDIPDDYWCYKNIRYVVSAGMFSGVTENTFSPTRTMTREMVIAVLWRLSGSPVVPGSACSFTDVSRDSYAYEAIRWGIYYGIVSGYSGDSFGYGVPVNRQQLVTFLYRYAKNYAGDDTAAFEETNILKYSDSMDIAKGMTQAFQWAIGAGYISGTTDTTLSPLGPATRAQVAAIFSRYCNQCFLKVPVFG